MFFSLIKWIYEDSDNLMTLAASYQAKTTDYQIISVLN